MIEKGHSDGTDTTFLNKLFQAHHFWDPAFYTTQQIKKEVLSV